MLSLIKIFTSPLVDWMVFFIMSFAFVGLGVKFYSMFDTSHYTYYQPDPNNPYRKDALRRREKLKIETKIINHKKKLITKNKKLKQKE